MHAAALLLWASASAPTLAGGSGGKAAPSDGLLNFTTAAGRQMSDAQALQEVRRGWQLQTPLAARDDDVRAEIRRRAPTRRPGPYRQAPRLRPEPSSGCGRDSAAPESGAYNLTVTDPILGSIERKYHLHVPERYDPDPLAPTPLVVDFHAWGWSSEDHLEITGMDTLADQRTVIVVYPEGHDDVVCEFCDEGSYSWNACGTTLWRESALGPTCQWEEDPDIPSACYPCHTSCQMTSRGCNTNPEECNTTAAGCDSSTCVDDSLFVAQLLDHLEATLCVDRRRVHMTGMSNGAIMNYEVATGQGNAALARRFASMAPAAGAPLMGFNFAPHAPIALMDIRGSLDNTVPANISNGWPAPWLPGEVVPGPNNSTLSADGFYYTTIDNITAAWGPTLGCEGPQAARHYPTRFDGISDFYCIAPEGPCSVEGGAGGEEVSVPLVRCYHPGGHTWPWRILMLIGENYYAELVYDFFEEHPRP